ncbi:MAG: SBBP repeat-containing protein [Candidatus Fermentibacter sp.]|nr:SBBP repeat-containing protein [Candidatus Fermentibacter sp.]
MIASGDASAQCDFPIEEWVSICNGTGNSFDHGNDIGMDSEGNIFVASASTGAGTSYDFVTMKYDSDGNMLWSRSFDGIVHGGDYPNALVVDGSGSVIITGDSKGNDGYDDYLTVKYDSDGNLCWSARYDASDYYDYARDVAVDSYGNVYVAGTTCYDEDHEYFTTIKYSSSGVQLWAVNMYAPNLYNDAAAIAIDGDGYVFVTGYSAGGYATVTYSPDGVEQWIRRLNTSVGANYPSDITVDAADNVLVTGSSLDYSTGYDYLTVKYSSEGALEWTARYDGSQGEWDYADVVCADASGNVIVTGSSFVHCATVKYDPDGELLWETMYPDVSEPYDMTLGTGGSIYVTGDRGGTQSDCMTVLYSSSGVQQWAVFYNGIADYDDHWEAVALDSNGDVYVTGTSWGVDSKTDCITIKYDGNTGIESGRQDVASVLRVTPNPSVSNPSILLDMPEPVECSVSVYSLDGRLVDTIHEGMLAAGVSTLGWDSVECPAGVYLVVARTIERTMSASVILLR